jgi:hypothetical protein
VVRDRNADFRKEMRSEPKVETRAEIAGLDCMEAKFYTTNQNIVVQEPLSVLVVQVDEFILQAAYEFLRSTSVRYFPCQSSGC